MIRQQNVDSKEYDRRTRIQKALGYCPACRKWMRRVETYRQHTFYENEASNYFTGCKPCSEQNDANWEAAWSDFYSFYNGLI